MADVGREMASQPRQTLAHDVRGALAPGFGRRRLIGGPARRCHLIMSLGPVYERQGPRRTGWQLVHNSMAHASTFEAISMCDTCNKLEVAHGS